MQLLPGSLTADHISVLKEYWNNNHQYAYVNGRPVGTHPDVGRYPHIDQRLLIKPGSRAHTILKNIVEQHFAPGTNFWANYQRQICPHALHVDEYGKDRTQPTWTMIFALDTEPRFKVYVFKELFNSCADIEPYFQQRVGQPPVSDFSSREDVEHNLDCYDPQANRCDHLELDGVWSYQAGDGILFDTNAIHTTSYWVKHTDLKIRDLVQLHIGAAEETSYDREAQANKGEVVPDLADMRVKQ